MKRLLILIPLLLSACAVRYTPPLMLRTAPHFYPLGDSGAQEANLFVEELPDHGGRLEVRIIGIGQGAQLIVPTDHEVALEVRTGNAIVTTDGERIEHAAGDIWVVPVNANVVVEASAETTVLRAMYFIRD